MPDTQIDVSGLAKGTYFTHAVLGERVFTREATAKLLGCSLANLYKIRDGKNGLKPLKGRYNGQTVYAESDIKLRLNLRK